MENGVHAYEMNEMVEPDVMVTVLVVSRLAEENEYSWDEEMHLDLVVA